MFVELLQKGVRTVYRTFGAHEVTLDREGVHVHSFRFDGPAARPIVFLHGLGDASTTWYRIVRPLRERTTVLAIDLPPFGLSRLEDRDFLPPDQQADVVAHVLDHVFDEPVTLVGQSMGGWIAQWVLAEHPEQVDRAVLVSSAGAPLPGSLEAVDLLTPRTVEESLAYLDSLWYDPPSTMNLVARPMMQRLQEPEIQAFLDAMTEEHLLTHEQLNSIEVPTLMVWGLDDGLLDPETPGYMAQHWGGPIERTYLARAGHMPHIERPRTFLKRLVDFAELG